jgi:hypothetical protein
MMRGGRRYSAGRDDLVVGSPGEIHAGIMAGSAQVFYGATGVLNMANDQLFVQAN